MFSTAKYQNVVWCGNGLKLYTNEIHTLLIPFQESNSCLCKSDFGGASFNITKFPWDVNAIPTDFHGYGPVSRYGHTLIHCDDDIMYLFGGMSLEYGLLNDIWQYSFQSNTWTGIRPLTSDQPSPR